MSRSSADRLRVALVPGEIALARGARRQALAAGRDAASLLPVLDAALADAAWRARHVEVVLSQHFVRHVLTPPPGRVLPFAEEQALVNACLREIYGELVEDWEIRVHSQPPQAGLVGAATDSAFARALDALLARHGFRSIAIHPLASLAARRLPKAMDGWWALVEPGWLSLFGSTGGHWQHVAGLPIDDSWQVALPDLVARESGSTASPIPPAAWLHPLGLGAVAAPHDTALQWRILPHDAQTGGALALLDV